MRRVCFSPRAALIFSHPRPDFPVSSRHIFPDSPHRNKPARDPSRLSFAFPRPSRTGFAMPHADTVSEDWTTQGDWIGRYGHEQAFMPYPPLETSEGTWTGLSPNQPSTLNVSAGPHLKDGADHGYYKSGRDPTAPPISLPPRHPQIFPGRMERRRLATKTLRPRLGRPRPLLQFHPSPRHPPSLPLHLQQRRQKNPRLLPPRLPHRNQRPRLLRRRSARQTRSRPLPRPHLPEPRLQNLPPHRPRQLLDPRRQQLQPHRKSRRPLPRQSRRRSLIDRRCHRAISRRPPLRPTSRPRPRPQRIPRSKSRPRPLVRLGRRHQNPRQRPPATPL